jgi:hypothetical protein
MSGWILNRYNVRSALALMRWSMRESARAVVLAGAGEYIHR